MNYSNSFYVYKKRHFSLVPSCPLLMLGFQLFTIVRPFYHIWLCCRSCNVWNSVKATVRRGGASI